MKVEFKKTGERRYGVFIKRENAPDLEMNPAPGFDALMPHDLLHFLVEQELDLRNGIFGQIAAGGTAGTFHQTPSEKSNTRTASRLRRKTAQRGEKLLKTGTDDCAKSERATYVCLADWLANSTDAKLKTRGAEMQDGTKTVLAQMSESERSKLNKNLAAIRTRMNESSAHWSALKINESMTLQW